MVEAELKHRVLMFLIRISVDIMPGASVIPSTYIAKYVVNAPIRDVKKALKELVADGLATYTHEGGWNEYSERPFCIWGYCITKKAMDLPEYKQAKEEMDREIQRIWFGSEDNTDAQ